MEENHKPEDVQMTPERVTDAQPTTEKKKSITAYIVSAIVVIAIIVGVIFVLEQQGKLSTGIFVDSDGISAKATVATVNGVEIKGADLTTSINQIVATAQLQGIDTSDEQVQNEIQAQAVEMLINTELLKQEADDRGIEITAADVQSRIDLLITEIGSEDALNERMSTLGIDAETLRRDVKSELMIQALLDEVFAEEAIEITEAEIAEVYESAGGADADLPALEEVRAQVEAQIQASKEQQIVDSFVTELRTDAEVDMAE